MKANVNFNSQLRTMKEIFSQNFSPDKKLGLPFFWGGGRAGAVRVVNGKEKSEWGGEKDYTKKSIMNYIVNWI